MKLAIPIRWQFSSRTLLILVLLISPALALVGGIKFESNQFRTALEKVRPDFEVQIVTDPNDATAYNKFVQEWIDPDAYSSVQLLEWKGEYHIGPEVIPQLGKLREVSALRFSKHDWRGDRTTSAKVTWHDEELKALAKIESLQSLSLDGVYSAQGIDSVLGLRLHQLLLPETPLDKEIAERILRCETLGSVGFNCRNTTAEAIGIVATLPELSHLTVRYVPQGKDLFRGLAECRKLKAVLIYDSNLSPEDGEALSQLRLHQVQIVDCQVESGFFRPFARKGGFPLFTTFRNGRWRTYSSHAHSVEAAEAAYSMRAAEKQAQLPTLSGQVDKP